MEAESELTTAVLVHLSSICAWCKYLCMTTVLLCVVVHPYCSHVQRHPPQKAIDHSPAHFPPLAGGSTVPAAPPPPPPPPEQGISNLADIVKGKHLKESTSPTGSSPAPVIQVGCVPDSTCICRCVCHIQIVTIHTTFSGNGCFSTIKI